MSGPAPDLTPLTEAQRQFAEEHVGLIWAYLRIKEYKARDWSDVAALGYIRAVKSYKPERGGTFSTWAFWCMRGEIARELLKRKATMRSAPTLSMDALAESCGDGIYHFAVNCKIFSSLKPDYSLETAPFTPLLTARQKKIARLLADGTTKKDIREFLGFGKLTPGHEIDAIRSAILKSGSELEEVDQCHNV